MSGGFLHFVEGEGSTDIINQTIILEKNFFNEGMGNFFGCRFQISWREGKFSAGGKGETSPKYFEGVRLPEARMCRIKNKNPN